MISLTRRHLIALTLGGYFSYLLFGIFDSMRGATLSTLLADLPLSYALGGLIVMGQYAGYFTATLLVGVLADRTSPRSTLILAGVSLTAGVPGYTASTALPLLIFFMFFIGMGLGSLELGGCNIISAIYPEKKGRHLNILAAIAGCGAFLTPAAAGLLLDAGLSWRLVYRLGLVFAVPCALYFVFLRCPRLSQKAQKIMQKKQRASQSLALFSMNLSNFAYMAAEIGTATWLADFYCHVKHFSLLEASAGLSLFYIGITLGRLGGSLFVDRIGHIPSILAASLLAVGCTLAGVYGPDALAILVSVSGLCYSVIFPTSSAVVSGLAPGHPGRALGVFLSFGGLGGMFGPWLLGILNDLAGPKTGMACSCLFGASILLFTFAAGKPSAKR